MDMDIQEMGEASGGLRVGNILSDNYEPGSTTLV